MRNDDVLTSSEWTSGVIETSLTVSVEPTSTDKTDDDEGDTASLPADRGGDTADALPVDRRDTGDVVTADVAFVASCNAVLCRVAEKTPETDCRAVVVATVVATVAHKLHVRAQLVAISSGRVVHCPSAAHEAHSSHQSRHSTTHDTPRRRRTIATQSRTQVARAHCDNVARLPSLTK